MITNGNVYMTAQVWYTFYPRRNNFLILRRSNGNVPQTTSNRTIFNSIPEYIAITHWIATQNRNPESPHTRRVYVYRSPVPNIPSTVFVAVRTQWLSTIWHRKRKMAAHSGGVDWASVIKPILSSNNGSLTKADITNLTKTILKW